MTLTKNLCDTKGLINKVNENSIIHLQLDALIR